MISNLEVQNEVELSKADEAKEKSEPLPMAEKAIENADNTEDNTLGIIDTGEDKNENKKEMPKEALIINNPFDDKNKPFTNLSKEDQELLEKVPIKLTSDNFLEGIPPFLRKPDYRNDVARVHVFLKCLEKDNKEKPKESEIIYKNISGNFIGQLMALDHEVTPVEHDMEFFKKYITKTTQFAIGAFIKIEHEFFLIGYCLSELTSEKRFKQSVPHVIRQKTCCTKLKDFFTKGSVDKYGYITEIVVINEYRRMGIAKELINKTVEELKNQQVLGVYTHVVEYNISAIRFFDRIEWNYGGVIFSYFNYNNTYYDGQVYYIILYKKEEFVKAEIRGYSQPPLESWYQKAYRVIADEISQ